jgi:precorrin-6B methylase 1
VQNTCPNTLAVAEGDPQLSNIQRQAKEVGAKVQIVVQHLNGLSSTSILKHGDKN